MFHEPMGRFQLELIYYLTYFFTFVPSNTCVILSCRPFVVNATFSRPTRPVVCCINNEKPTGKKYTSVGWDDGEK